MIMLLWFRTFSTLLQYDLQRMPYRIFLWKFRLHSVYIEWRHPGFRENFFRSELGQQTRREVAAMKAESMKIFANTFPGATMHEYNEIVERAAFLSVLWLNLGLKKLLFGL